MADRLTGERLVDDTTVEEKSRAALVDAARMILPGAFSLAAAQLRSGRLRSTVTREDGREVLVERLPWGPVACLVPWNAPAPMATHKVANALAAGCPAIVKPSEYAPFGTTVLAEAIASALHDAGAPAALFQLVQGGARARAQLAATPGSARSRSPAAWPAGGPSRRLSSPAPTRSAQKRRFSVR